MLARGTDGAMLRFTLATEYFERGDIERALAHAEAAVKLDADYSAAWRLLGKIHAADGSKERAAASFNRGIAVAEQRGDRQAAKEMRVYLRRLEAGKE
jgi:Tfp pilus assembly protein PilF